MACIEDVSPFLNTLVNSNELTTVSYIYTPHVTYENKKKGSDLNIWFSMGGGHPSG